MDSKEANQKELTKKGLRTYQRIIDVARVKVRSNGYTETTVQMICDEAGIGVGTFYHYFNSKEDVLLAYINSNNQPLFDFYAQQDKTSYGRALLAVANLFVEMCLDEGKSTISQVCTMVLQSTIDFSKFFENAFYQIVRDAYLQGQEKGEFSKDISVDAFSYMVISEWFYFTSLWCNNSREFNLRVLVTQNFPIILKMVSNPTRIEA